MAILQLKAQETDPKVWAALPLQTGETVFVNTNDNTLLAGETLYFKLFCLNPDDKTPSHISKIAHVELIGNDLKTIIKQKLTLEDGVATGDLFIPASTPSGQYKIIAYTKRMLDVSTDNFFSADISIINPFHAYSGKTAIQSTASKTLSGNNITISPNKQHYAQREKVLLDINPDGKLPSGNYSISVRKSNPLSAAKIHATSFNPTVQKNVADTLPELRGEMISGQITSGKKSVTGKNIALSIPGKSFGFKIVQTDSNGKFNFVLDKQPDSQNMVLQIMEPDRVDYAIHIDTEKKPDFSKLQFEALQLNPALKKEIENRAIALQVENAYYDRKKDSLKPVIENAPFFHPLEKTYVLDDYTRFPTMKETIIEVLKELYFTTDQGHYSIHLRNMTMDNEVYGPPLIMVDGLLIQDIDELFSYGAKYIEKVSLINEPYVYGPKTFSGIVSFTTKLEDFKSNASGDYIQKLTLERPVREKHYFTPDYTNDNSRIPDYRYQLLWSEISGETQTLSFYTSDISGTFEITLEGFSAAGKPVSWLGTFEVE